eukprot:768524-Hanusia_phi.AAC.5
MRSRQFLGKNSKLVDYLTPTTPTIKVFPPKGGKDPSPTLYPQEYPRDPLCAPTRLKKNLTKLTGDVG